ARSPPTPSPARASSPPPPRTPPRAPPSSRPWRGILPGAAASRLLILPHGREPQGDGTSGAHAAPAEAGRAAEGVALQAAADADPAARPRPPRGQLPLRGHLRPRRAGAGAHPVQPDVPRA